MPARLHELVAGLQASHGAPGPHSDRRMWACWRDRFDEFPGRHLREVCRAKILPLDIQSGNIFPGLRMVIGSSAPLILRCRLKDRVPRARARKWRFSKPLLCPRDTLPPTGRPMPKGNSPAFRDREAQGRGSSGLLRKPDFGSGPRGCQPSPLPGFQPCPGWDAASAYLGVSARLCAEREAKEESGRRERARLAARLVGSRSSAWMSACRLSRTAGSTSDSQSQA